MANWFEDVTKTLADEKIGRRTALRRVAGTVAGVALASAIPGAALAKGRGKAACPSGGGTCSTGFVNCKNNPNPNCYCFSGTQMGAGHCGCNSPCENDPNCMKNSDCPRGSFCSCFNGCNCGAGLGVCLPKCKGKNKNCQLGSGHGLTAAGRVV